MNQTTLHCLLHKQEYLPMTQPSRAGFHYTDSMRGHPYFADHEPRGQAQSRAASQHPADSSGTQGSIPILDMAASPPMSRRTFVHVSSPLFCSENPVEELAQQHNKQIPAARLSLQGVLSSDHRSYSRSPFLWQLVLQTSSSTPSAHLSPSFVLI